MVSPVDESPIRREHLSLLNNCEPDHDQLRSRVPDPLIFGFKRAEQISIPVDRLSVDLFRTTTHRTVAEYWIKERDHRGGVPLSERFDAMQVRAALGDLLLLEVNDDQQDFRYRVYGTRVADHSGFDWTGRLVSELHEPARSQFLFQYRSVCDLGVAIYSEHDSAPEVSRIVRWCRLILPLADTTGRIDRILVGNVMVLRSS